MCNIIKPNYQVLHSSASRSLKNAPSIRRSFLSPLELSLNYEKVGLGPHELAMNNKTTNKYVQSDKCNSAIHCMTEKSNTLLMRNI